MGPESAPGLERDAVHGRGMEMGGREPRSHRLGQYAPHGVGSGDRLGFGQPVAEGVEHDAPGFFQRLHLKIDIALGRHETILRFV